LWPAEERAPRVRLLPANVPFTALPPQDEDLALSVGIAEQDLGPVRIDFAAEPHLLLLGDSRSGKTGFLRALARRITDTHPPSRARVLLVDHRRSLLGEVPATHLLGHGTDGTATRRLMTEAAQGMKERMPGPGVTPDQLRRRSWWSGPELFVLIDDYDLVVSSLDNPLQPLLEFLPQGRELGLHVVTTRRSGGAGRAGAVRAVPGPVARHRLARPDALRGPGRGPAARRRQAGAAATGPRPPDHAGRPAPHDPARLAAPGGIAVAGWCRPPWTVSRCWCAEGRRCQ
jgi:hypothetical protein